MKTVEFKSSLAEINLFAQTVSIKMPAVEAFKEIGRSLGLYYPTGRDERVIVSEQNGHRELVLESDLGYHGSCSWIYVKTLSTDEAHIQQYEQFQAMLKTIENLA